MTEPSVEETLPDDAFVLIDNAITSDADALPESDTIRLQPRTFTDTNPTLTSLTSPFPLIITNNNHNNIDNHNNTSLDFSSRNNTSNEPLQLDDEDDSAAERPHAHALVMRRAAAVAAAGPPIFQLFNNPAVYTIAMLFTRLCFLPLYNFLHLAFAPVISP